jgi:hypothetical protein
LQHSEDFDRCDGDRRVRPAKVANMIDFLRLDLIAPTESVC